MKNLLTWHYWFNLRPDSLMPLAQKLFIILLLILIVAAIISAILKKKGSIYRGFLKRLYNFCLSNSLIALLLLFFNYEFVPFFSARFWLGFWVIIMIIWLGFILKSLGKIGTQRKKLEKERELKKYLP